MIMKKRSTKNYIVIGTAHLGMDKAVLKVINVAAKHYNAQVVHVGPLANVDEINMWRRRENKIRVWENQSKVKAEEYTEEKQWEIKELDVDIKDLESVYEYETESDAEKADNKLESLRKKREALEQKIEVNWENVQKTRETIEEEMYNLEYIQQSRIDAIKDILGDNAWFVCNDELKIPNSDINPKNYFDKRLMLGKHLFVTAVPANGDKVAGQPITDRTFRMLSGMKSSNIIPHMTPNTRPFARPGLNQAYNFFTTGSLQFHDYPKKITDAYKSAAKPSCILVSVDQENGEFHQQRLRIKLIRSEVSHKHTPHIIHDGLVFDASGQIIELDSKDKGLHETDMHCSHEHMGVVSACRSLNTIHKPSVFIDGGDHIDFGSVSRHTKHSPGARENLRLIDDISAGAKMFDAVCNDEEFPWVKKKVLLDSNHAEWVTNFVDENPSLKGFCDWQTLANTFFTGWDVFIRTGGADKFFTFGDLIVKHADKEGTVAKAQDVYGNYLGGHHHSFQELGDAVFAGPGCGLGPKYLQNSATSWQNQLTTLTKYKGVTCKHPKTILHSEDEKKSRFCYQGVIYEVKFHTYK